ncbi:hypothetical protein TREMEDRAFT_70893 [Tremella mesenterica DSM 1558]|uniref:uncharacterized protein n=1 Tax=Tremella mesenterica (strain ATCC 24925 / CBS 8224 / DSM 1558 / NBRC 9311 / NRRL Y-6157 / RJB 2259-6 / UBC 559-6) TaxID=578456 RepID=UPI0003F49DED|nr:uncharacterized protein TREMEDRAFT_70893 [Tremella mesenterica DSM 1558]EIW73092.1 hypothetical protein TREMEDRAFT_70893 [Tremella mesenterica DSM 1558]
MNPGDIYRPPTSGPYSPTGPRPLPTSNTYPQAQQFSNPYEDPPPIQHQPQPFPVSQTQPFPSRPSFGSQPINHPGDPFRNPPEAPLWHSPEGSHHYPSLPPTSPIAMQQIGGPLSPRNRPHSGPQPQYQTSPPPRTSIVENPFLPDHGMTSPPPLLPHQSSEYPYPPRMSIGGSQSYVGHLDDDANDSAPLLSHAHPDSSLVGGMGAIPTSHSAMSMRPDLSRVRYQLSDAGSQIPLNGMGGMGESDVGVQGYGNENGYEGDEPSNVHYGPIPTRILRRNRTQKRVQLFQGHLVLDIDVPSLLLDKCSLRDGNEFTKMRYTAVTCDPNDFVEDRYTLRQKLYDPPRQTELFIVITMYNEDDVLFCRTMRGIMQNIAHLCTRSKSKTWGKDGWKKVVVCVVADGRLKINPRTRSVLAALGVYQEGVGKNVVNGKPVTAHLYEYTTQLWIDSGGRIEPGDKSKHVPVQIIFCLKEKNQKKINSHRWFFNAFGACLRPNVCVLLDVGTQPGPDSVYHLWKSFDINSSVGGACGEIVALKGLFWRNLINPLVAGQNFEYKMSNILDKPLESVFGYITVLPGAFSAYRYIALQNDEKGNGPLKQYFIGETMHGSGAGIFAANMYLAEDRILCWELVSKRGCKWKLHYVKSAYAITDVPDAVPELVSQRRRWLNGSFFAAIHSIVHFGYLYRSSHSVLRKFFLHIELIYQTINLIFSWFALGNFYIAFVVLTNSLETLSKNWRYANLPLQYLYVALLLLCFLLSLGNRPAGSKIGYTISMIGFALLTIYMLFAAVYLAVAGIENVEHSGPITADTVFGNKIFRNIILSLAATYGLYILASLLALEPWHMITSFIQYLLLAPSYINVMNVYAFCNVHDVSWGTKGSDKVSEDLGVVKSHSDNKNEVTVDVPVEQQDINEVYAAELKVLASKAPKEEHNISADQKQEDYYKNFRTNVLLAWTMSNGALVAAILQPSGGSSSLATTYMGILLFTVAGLAFFRFVGSTSYLIVRLFAGE